MLIVLTKIVIAFLTQGGTLFLSGIFKEYFIEYCESDPKLLLNKIEEYIISYCPKLKDNMKQINLVICN